MAHELELTPEETGNRVDLGKLAPVAGIVAIVGAVITAVLFFSNQDMAGSYLYGLIFWVSITLGMFGWSVLHHAVRGSWSVSILRLLEAGGGPKMLAVMGALFIPIFLKMDSLYEWAQADVVAQDRILQGKRVFLNPGTFIAITVIFFAIWIGFSAKMRN